MLKDVSSKNNFNFNFQAGDLIITKEILLNCKKRTAIIIQVHEPEYSDDWFDPDNPSISYQYSDTGDIYRQTLEYFIHHFLPTVTAKARWKHIPVKT
jgi:hypothetical protein